MLYVKNGRIFTMAGPVWENGQVLIENGKIRKAGEKVPCPKKAAVIDAKGGWVLPGLIEAHCHIGITEEKKGFEGDDCNEVNQPITPYLKALDAVNPMDSAFHNALSAGITTVMAGPGSSNIVGGQFLAMKTCGRVIDRMIVKEPAAMKVAFGENPKTNYSGQNKMPSTRMSAGAMLRQELAKAKNYQSRKKQAAQNGEDFETDFQLECWLPVLEGQIPLKAHVHRADDILTAIRIAKEWGLRLTLDHCTEGHLIAGEIREAGCPAIVGPTLSSRNKIEVQNMDFKTPGILQKAGVLVAITTDHPVTRIQYLPICAGFAAKEGLGVDHALEAITCNPARICGIEDRVGTIEPGKDGDLAIFDGNPMEVFTKTLYTIVEGQIAYRQDEPEKERG